MSTSSIKVSELGDILSVNNNDYILVSENSGDTSKKATVEQLRNCISVEIYENIHNEINETNTTLVNNYDSLSNYTNEQIDNLSIEDLRLSVHENTQNVNYLRNSVITEIEENLDSCQIQTDTNTLNIDQISIDLDTVESKIPNQATSTNQLADKAFVNSSIQNVAAYFITKKGSGDTEPRSFLTYSDLTSTTIEQFYSGRDQRNPTRNDYCVVLSDETHIDEHSEAPTTTRYIYTGETATSESYNPSDWQFQYIVNNSPYTATQWEAINSGISKEIVDGLGDIESKIKHASEEDYGIIKIGDGLSVDDGVVGLDKNNITIDTVINLRNELDDINEEINNKVSQVKYKQKYEPSTPLTLGILEVDGKPYTIYGPTVGGGGESSTYGGIVNVGIGSIVAFAGIQTIPDNTLLCNGREVSRTEYKELFDVIGITYGEGDGSTTFNLPNISERFIEGTTNPGETGNVKEAGLPNITGHFNTRLPSGGASFSGPFKSTGQYKAYRSAKGSADSYGITYNFDASRSSRIYGSSPTVQPPAIMMRYVIVYKNTFDGFGDLAYKNQLSAHEILNIGDLAFKDKIISSDILGTIGIDQVDGLQNELDSKISSVTVTPHITDGTKLATITIDGKSSDIYGSTVNGGSVGVIDGTILETNTYTNLSGNPFKFSYEVKNDCWLSISGKYTTPANSIQSFKVNGNVVASYRDPNGITNDEDPISFPVKKGSTITIENTSDMSNVELTITEYKLVSTNPQSVAQPDCVSYVIESGRFNSTDGTIHTTSSENDSWYRLYSDGWCEQGGYLTNQKFNQTVIAVILNKTYTNLSYNCSFGIQVPYGVNIAMINCYSREKTLSSFNIYKDFASHGTDEGKNCNITWEAKGYVN